MPSSVVLFHRLVIAPVLLLAVVSLIAPARAAQDEQASPSAALELDLQRLLFDSQQQTLNDPVWELTPEPGRQIVLLPFVVKPVDRQIELSRPPINLRGGRFLGFFIAASDAQQSDAPAAIDFSLFADTSPGSLDRLLFGQGSDQAGGADPDQSQPVDASVEANFDLDEPDAQSLADQVPRLTRSLTLWPDGSVHWLMDRSIASAKLRAASEQNLYPYKIDAALLREQEPPPAERITKQEGESTRDYAERRRVQQLQEREKIEAYRELRDSLRDLPEQFSEPSPKVIYAVVEVREGEGLSLQGPPPLPWTLEDSSRAMLASLAQAGGNLSEEQRKSLAGLAQMVDGRQALDAQAVALALLRGGVAGSAVENDAAFQLLAKLLASEDPIARRIALYSVARAEPQSRATAKLLDLAGQSAKGEESELLRLASLRTLFAIEVGVPESASFVATTVNQALADPNGPDAARVLDELLRANQALAQQGASDVLAQVDVVLINRVNFTVVPDDQNDAVIDVVLQYASINSLAAGWLDVKLLRSEKPERITRTLERLAKAQAYDKLPEPIAQAFAQLIFTVPMKRSADSDPTVLMLAASIPLESDAHGLVRALDSADAQQQELAWQSLAHFQVVQASVQGAEVPGADASAKTFEAIIGKGLKQPKTPQSLVAFLLNHAQGPLADAAALGMFRLLTDPAVNQEVASSAAGQLIGSELNISQPLTGLSSSQQVAVVRALYKHLQGGAAPAVAGLVAEPGSGLLPWFTQQIESGKLPTPRQWAQQVGGAETGGGEQQLLQWIASPDLAIASGAAAALVINAGGTQLDQERFTQTISAMTDRTPESVGQAWSQERLKLYARALADAKGTYKLVVTVSSDSDAIGQFGSEGAVAAAPKRIELGIVELKADGVTVSLSVASVPVTLSPERLAIRLQSLASLRTLSNPELVALPLSQFDQPLDLLPQEGGSWSGQTRLPDGQSLQVSLEPAK